MSDTPLNDSPTKAASAPGLGERIRNLAALLDHPQEMRVALVIIFVLAAWLRFHGLNWDSGHHLHPDERFLSTVTNDLQWPTSFSNYFDPNTSTLSPYSLPNMGLFVYGTLPIYVVKWLAIQLDSNSYDKITLVGRALSVLFDLGAIFFLFLIGRKLYGRRVALLAAALLAFTVLNIQLSHFYAVDTFANLFIVAAMYFLIVATTSGRWLDYALTGLMFGLGLASKVSVMTLAVPILVGLGLDYYHRSRKIEPGPALEQTLVRFLTLFGLAFLTFRVLQPVAFAGPGFLNWSLNPRWLQDIIEQQKTVSGAADLPWVQQWTNRSILFPLYNIVFWGMGLPLGLASLAGYGLALYELIRRKKIEHLLLVVYVGVTFVYHAATFVKFMRYFLPIYPFLVLFAAYLIAWLWNRAFRKEEAPAPAPEEEITPPPDGTSRKWSRFERPVALTAIGIIIGGTLLYALAFSNIYSHLNSRIQATIWMYDNLPPGSTLANEHWDDWLPIGGVEGKTAYGDNGLFKSVEMKNYEDDTPDKLNAMVDNLTQADYIVLSSNRLYDSIPRLPMRYPMTTRYYQMLFDGQLGFERIAEFTSYPTLFGIRIPDQTAEESFSVYDHPRVQIFKKTAAFDPQKVRAALGAGINWDSVMHLTPVQASSVPAGLLMLSPRQEAQYQQASTTSSAEVNENSWGSHMPVVAWVIALLLIGLLALPLTMVTFGRLADRGYSFGKAVGLLLVAWGAWMVSSIHLAPFTFWAILVVMLLLGIASAVIAWKRWDEIQSFMRAHWRLLVIEEVLFWVFFGLLLFIRWNNPDLWHPGLGGEKPMDLAYLTAITKTPYFPSYDPWFAGGYINYYYFGFVLAATLIHLTGIVPTIAYNLAVPTFFALMAIGSFGLAFNFAEWWQSGRSDHGKTWLGIPRAALLAGLCGALFVAIIGNLAQVQLLWNAVRGLSQVPTPEHASPLVYLAQFTDGLSQILAGKPLSIRTEWWYWNATRVIPPGPGEAGPINELPFFTFLFGDLHAHMMALPYTVLALGLALNIIRQPVAGSRSEEKPWWRDPAEVLTLALLALTTGALWPMNTWDFPTYVMLAAAALACREYARRRKVDMAGLWAVAWRIGLVVVAGWVFFLPFHRSTASAYFGASLWDGSHTALKYYLIIHGFFLFVLVTYLLVEFFKGRGHNALVRTFRAPLLHLRRLGRLQTLTDRLVHPAPRMRLAVSLSGVVFILVVAALLIRPVVGLALALAAIAALLLFSTRPDPRRQFLLCMIGLGLLLTAVVEVVVLKGDISRMNTVFKFYLQVWVLWAIACASVLPELAARFAGKPQPRIERAPFAEPDEGGAWTPTVAAQLETPRRGRATNPWGRRWWWGFGILLGACLLYPATAAPVRMRDRFEGSTSKTLDGTAYMRTSTYFDNGNPIVLEWDRQATEWLRNNVHGMPTILEANTQPLLYGWGSRVSIYTGFPTVIGWDWHQKQQRSVLPGPIVDNRIADVRTIYSTTDLAQAKQLLEKYDVKYVYLGALERLYYGGDGLNKFTQASDLFSLVYQNDQVQIYQVH